MGKSTAPRLADVRKVFRLLSEVQQLARERRPWEAHAILGLCRLLGARQGSMVRFSGWSADGDLKLLRATHSGWMSPQALAMWEQAILVNEPRQDVLIDRCTRMDGRVRTVVRAQIIDPREYAHTEVSEIARVAEVGDHLCAWYHRGGSDGRVDGLTLHRACNERDYSLRQRNVLHLFMRELYLLARAGKLMPADGPATRPKLSPRQQEVLDRLLAGDSVKQAAVFLGIRPRTAEDHVKAIYKRFGVNSRGELLARFVR